MFSLPLGWLFDEKHDNEYAYDYINRILYQNFNSTVEKLGLR